MWPIRFSPTWLAALLFAGTLPAAAQLPGAQSDPLSRIREAAKTNVEACSMSGETLCEQVAPKIIQNAMGESPLAENLRRLTEVADARAIEIPVAMRVVDWAISAFRDAGVDVHTEYANLDGSPSGQENVVAEIRGREKPDEWVLVGAHLDSWPSSPVVLNNDCEAAMVVEAARDIWRTGIRPRRSIRFVLFARTETGTPGSWAYVRSHRAELDRARAAIVFRSGCARMNGYLVNGRHDIEPGVQEAMKPIESLGAAYFLSGAGLGTDDYDFLVEGVPTLAAIHASASYVLEGYSPSFAPDQIDIANLKRNTAIAAVTAFGIAERAEPLGPRQSRAEIKSLLKATGLEQGMKTSGLWASWESGQRGRLP